MPNTTFIPTDEQWKNIITMHNKVDGKSVVGITYEGSIFENFPCTNYLGGAGLISNIHDYSNFTEMLLNGGSGAKTADNFEKDVFSALF